jgi:hypothetical protein
MKIVGLTLNEGWSIQPAGVLIDHDMGTFRPPLISTLARGGTFRRKRSQRIRENPFIQNGAQERGA